MDQKLIVRAADRADQARFGAVLTAAFITDPVARWVWPDPLQFIEAFMPFSNLFGGKSLDLHSAYVIGDFSGVVQWLPPGVGSDDDPLLELLADTIPEPRYGETMALFEEMAGHHPDEPHWYVPLIGVDPVCQGRGYGTELMRHGLAICDRAGQPVYLEATSPASRALYERLGFDTLAELSAAESPPMFAMLRSPK
ncbi:MAG: GNAT family N-acetyltransferase [Cereibacter sphaeroides]|uniref:GNAT family N-acetyltransferase n=1 Tax=Cereibacter sphaeroides TaxID=1063 RepID=A0A2W5TXU5_CERSP|nr:MAG: GNAT family N-acetyltransferase [Cereibacter sphaeroides]